MTGSRTESISLAIKLEKLDVRIGELMTARVDAEEALLCMSSEGLTRSEVKGR